MDEELKRIVEAILFAAARKMELEELAKLCKRPEADVLQVLRDWQGQLREADSPTMLVQDGSTWRLTVREKYIPVIKRVVTKTELPKSILETLAVVAYKAPVLQSKVVKIRTNKAYDHLNFLENAGFITREKSGRTKLIRLAPKFFEYFDIDPSKLKKKWRNPGEVEQAIEAKEREIEESEKVRMKRAEKQLEAPEIRLQANGKSVKLELYEGAQPVDMTPTAVQPYYDELGELEVYGEEEPAKPKVVTEPSEIVTESGEGKEPRKEVSEAIKALHGEEESEEEPEGEPEESEEQESEEPKGPEKPAESEEEPSEEPEEKSEESEEQRKSAEQEKPEEPSKEKAAPGVESKERKKPQKAEKPGAEKKPGKKAEVGKPERQVKEAGKEKAKPKQKSEKPEREAQTKGAPEPKEQVSSSERLAKDIEQHKKTAKPRTFEKGKGLYPEGVPKEVSSRIDERVKAILGEKEEETEGEEE